METQYGYVELQDVTDNVQVGSGDELPANDNLDVEIFNDDNCPETYPDAVISWEGDVPPVVTVEGTEATVNILGGQHPVSVPSRPK